jgi:GNAT acetyltransferase-like protein
MKVSVVDSFADLATSFRRRASFPAVSEFFLSLDWFELLFEHGLPRGHAPRIYIASDERGDPHGALYCCHVTGSRRLLSLTSFYTMMYGPVIMSAAADVGAIIRALVAHIASERPRWHTVELRFLRPDTLAFPKLVDALGEYRFARHRYFQYENWFAPVEGARFAQYFATRPSQLRNTIRRRAKKAEQQHRVDIRVLTQTSADLEDAIAAFTRVYESSWKRPEPFPDFMPALIRRCAALGILRLGEVRLDGIPAAAQVWINSRDRAVIYKLAYDERYKDLSVGSILSTRLFERALDGDRVTELDYGVGSESYKRDWMTKVRPIEGLQAFNLATTTGRVHAMIEAARRVLRRKASLPAAAGAGDTNGQQS